MGSNQPWLILSSKLKKWLTRNGQHGRRTRPQKEFYAIFVFLSSTNHAMLEKEGHFSIMSLRIGVLILWDVGSLAACNVSLMRPTVISTFGGITQKERTTELNMGIFKDHRVCASLVSSNVPGLVKVFLASADGTQNSNDIMFGFRPRQGREGHQTMGTMLKVYIYIIRVGRKPGHFRELQIICESFDNTLWTDSSFLPKTRRRSNGAGPSTSCGCRASEQF